MAGAERSRRPRAVVVGQIARDIVVCVDQLPEVGAAADVRLRREMLGGKGANQAVGLAQLGVAVSLVGVVGSDGVGDDLLAQARRDRIDVSPVVRRSGNTALILEVLQADGGWRYLQDLGHDMLLTENDVAAAEQVLTGADAVLVQLQQPSAAAAAAATVAKNAGGLVVLDGVPADDGHREILLGAADVVRADARETGLLTGVHSDRVDDVARAAGDVLAAGPSLVVLAVAGGNLFAWRSGHLLVPLINHDVVDTTGAGDALVAALTAALLRGDPPPATARFAVAAASATVGHPGGRPDLTADKLTRWLAELAARGSAADQH